MENIIFCKKCVESNQRFVSSEQHKMKPNEKKAKALFDEEGVCLHVVILNTKKQLIGPQEKMISNMF